MLLLRRPTYPNLLPLSSRLHVASSSSHAHLPSLLPKIISTIFLLSPSPSAAATAAARLSPLRPDLSPSAALAAIRRLPNPISALGLFQLLRTDFQLAHLPQTYKHLINLLLQSGHCSSALQVFDQMPIDGHSPDDLFISQLLSISIRTGDFDTSLGLVERAAELGCRVKCCTFNSFLSSLVEKNRVQDAIFLLKEYSQKKVFKPDACSFNVVIKGFCRFGDVDSAMRVFEEMKILGCSPDTITHNIVIDGLCKDGQVDKGREFLRDVCSPNVITYTAMIAGYCKMGKMEMALEVYNEMVGLGIRPSRVTYNAMIDGYGKAGNMASAVSVFERMMVCGCSPDIVTLTSLIDGYCRGGRIDDAMRIWGEMSGRAIKPNVYTFSVVINSLCKMNRLSEARGLLKELGGRRDIVARAFIYNPVIDGFCKSGNVDEANSILMEMEERGCYPDKYTYTILIIGHCMKGRMSEAIDLFQRMAINGVTPDHVTVSSLVSCLLKAGMPGDAKQIMSVAARKDLGPDVSVLKEIPPMMKRVDVSVAV